MTDIIFLLHNIIMGNFSGRIDVSKNNFLSRVLFGSFSDDVNICTSIAFI